MKIGVLTGGGDCQGLNAAIRGVVYRAESFGWQVTGIRDGWAGLVGAGTMAPLTRQDVAHILPLGGTILGTSRTNPTKNPEHLEQVRRNLRDNRLEALVAIGGDDTLSVARKLFEVGEKTVGVPKTMDNDLAETDYTIGFDTATSIVVDALDRIRTTAASHHRAIVVEVMGRDAGWVAALGGMAGGADYIVVPEVPCATAEIAAHLKKRQAEGQREFIVVVSEGARLTDVAGPDDSQIKRDAFGHIRLDKRNVGELVAGAIEMHTGIETRATVLGHLQRGGTPTLADRVLGTRVGVAAVDYVKQGLFGHMPALRGTRIVPVKLADATARNRTLDLELLEVARVFF